MKLDTILKSFIKEGTLKIIDAQGNTHIGVGRPGPNATIRLHTPHIQKQLITNPELALGEGYMDQTITLEEGDLYQLLDLATKNLAFIDHAKHPLLMRFFFRLMKYIDKLKYFNPKSASKKNVAHHYDLTDELYKLFLDKDQQYSCAYFKSWHDDLETAQDNKKRHIANKLRLRPGMRVLDIGSGWGGMALFLAKEFDVSVTGLTLSERQYEVATNRAKEAGLSEQVQFFLRDYRDEHGIYDRIVSVGMFEHVGPIHYKAFFNQVHQLLNHDGMMLLHSIGCHTPRPTNAWFQKYIFPGGYAPSLSEVLPKIENERLYVSDIEVLYHHYAETLQHWRIRFFQNYETIKSLYDERFCRMWEFYLTACEVSFKNRDLMVFHIQMYKNPNIVPLTREYIYKDQGLYEDNLEEQLKSRRFSAKQG